MKLPVLIALAAVVVLVGFGFNYTSQPKFCGMCHEVQPAVAAWQKSLHAEVRCDVCHSRGSLSLVRQKISLVSEAIKHFSGTYQKPLNADSSLSKKIDSDGCLQCHTPKRIITPRKTITMDHDVHLDKGISCTTCHNRAAHPGLPDHKDNISMEGCFRCHGLSKTAIAPGKCSACHPKTFDLVPPTHKTGTWRAPDHGKTAKKDVSACMMCHQKTFCSGCHGVEVPHPDKFIKSEHGEVGSKSPQVCRKCHRQEDFCNECHHKGYNKDPIGWVPTHKNVVAQVGPAECFDCHGPTFCAWCHVRGEKQPRTQRQ